MFGIKQALYKCQLLLLEQRNGAWFRCVSHWDQKEQAKSEGRRYLSTFSVSYLDLIWKEWLISQEAIIGYPKTNLKPIVLCDWGSSPFTDLTDNTFCSCNSVWGFQHMYWNPRCVWVCFSYVFSIEVSLHI